MADVLQADVEQESHVSVVESVEDLAPRPSVPNDTCRAQQPQRVRHRGLDHVDYCSQVTDAQLARLEQRSKHPDPPRVAEDAEQPRHFGGLSTSNGSVPGCLDAIVIHHSYSAEFGTVRFARGHGGQGCSRTHLKNYTDEHMIGKRLGFLAPSCALDRGAPAPDHESHLDRTTPMRSARSNLTFAVQARSWRARRLCLALLGLALVAGCSSSAGSTHDGELVVIDATIDWPANPDLAAVRLTIRNGTDSDDVLVGVSSRVAEASVHRSETDVEGRSTMTAVDRLDVPAGDTVRFQGGGLHVMLRNPSLPLEIGDTVTVTLMFERGGERSVEAEVIEPGSDANKSEMETHDE